jgi:hypothetical protein
MPPTLDILHDHVNVCTGLNDLVQPDDVGVHEQTQDLDLTTNCDAATGTKEQGKRCFNCVQAKP